MLYRFRTKLKKRIFDHRIRGILKTPPIKYQEAPISILSMTCHTDVRMYLVAVKSLYHWLGKGKIVIIDDGTLNSEDRECLTHHLVAPIFVALKDIHLGKLIPGNTWERLALSVDLCAKDYVIQLDSDIVTTGPLDAVRDCIEQNRSFILGTRNGQNFSSLPEASAEAALNDAQSHIQIRSERALEQLPDSANLRYVRGSSGFYGLGIGATNRQFLEWFCESMLKIVGPDFHQWGTEQLSANFVVANAPNSRVMGFPDYACFGPLLPLGYGKLLHFIGSYRYDRGEYARRSHQAIAQMNGAISR
jgi:hypothetical protein